MDQRIEDQILEQLRRIGDALEKIARGNAPEEPNLVKPIEGYQSFDWSSIGASVVRQDSDGPTHLEYGGFVWSRRSPQNKFDGAIWYSRAAGKDEAGNVLYLRLITFREIKDVDPLPSKLSANITNGSTNITNATKRATNGSTNSTNETNFKTQLPEKPAATKQPKAARPGNGKLSREDYLKAAVSKKFNLSAQAAEAVAGIAGVPDDGKDPTADYSLAMNLAPYFAECKAMGMVKFTEARDILLKHGGDASQAIFEVRDSRKEAKR